VSCMPIIICGGLHAFIFVTSIPKTDTQFVLTTSQFLGEF